MKQLAALTRIAFAKISFTTIAFTTIAFTTIVLTATVCGCRLLETGYGDENFMVRAPADAVSKTAGVARSTTEWAGSKALSFGDDLDSDLHTHFISLGEFAAAAYRTKPALPEECQPLSQDEFASLALPPARYRYEPDTGFVEDADGVGFGARLFRREDGIVVAFRGSNAPGEDEHWMQDWIVDAHQGGGGIPKQYLYGAEMLSTIRRTFHESRLVVTGHSLGGGIAAYATIMLSDPGSIECATYNAAGISSVTLLSLPGDSVARASGSIVNIRSKGDPVSAIPGTQLVGTIYEVDNLRMANHSIDGLVIDMRRRAEGRRAGWLRDLFDD